MRGRGKEERDRHLWDLRGFPRSRLAHYDEDLVLLHSCEEFLSIGIHRQLPSPQQDLLVRSQAVDAAERVREKLLRGRRGKVERC